MALFSFIGGSDDYLVTRKGMHDFKEASSNTVHDFSQEVIEANVSNFDGVEQCIRLFQAAVQTVSLFSEKKVVWLRGVNFLSDTQLSKSDETKKQVEYLQAILSEVDSQSVSVIITAVPVDRRTREYKWFHKHGLCVYIEGEKNQAEWDNIIEEECRRLQIRMSREAKELLIRKVGGNARVIAIELEKLANYLFDDSKQSNASSRNEIVDVSERAILEMVPDFGESDFFEAVEAFYYFDLKWTKEALARYFFANKEARPLIAALQNRNRLMIQLRVLKDKKHIQRTISKQELDRFGNSGRQFFGDNPEKSTYNLFTQNIWYLGKLMESLDRATLKQLITFQQEYIKAFEAVLERPLDQESVMQDLAMRCLGQ